MTSYSYLVVGKGMMGAAAARHLSAASDSVAIIGAEESRDAAVHRGPFSSHADTARITTRLTMGSMWGRLTADSMAGYGALEVASGIGFHRPVGVVHAASPEFWSRRSARKLAAEQRILAPRLSPRELRADPFGWRLPAAYETRHEPAPAGTVDPRALIRAQLRVAQRQRAHSIHGTVVGAKRRGGGWELATADGRVVRAEKVLLCLGAYANAFGLLPRALDLRIKSETTVLVQISASAAQRYREMPPLIYHLKSSSLSGVYLTPPRRHRDSRWYLKLGANTDEDRNLTDLDSIQNWMRHGSATPRRDMRELVRSLLPELEVRRWRVKRCLVTYSAHRLPYIDEVDDGLFVATAGNGAAAACGDTLGGLAADLMVGRSWPSVYPRQRFSARFIDTPAERADDTPTDTAADAAADTAAAARRVVP